MNESASFSPDIHALLTPIPGAAPAGPSLRYDPLYLGIRQAREEDDASVPMGEWERPLKKADWRAVSAKSVELLGSRSKDIQVAAWLCESWTRQHQVEGFNAAADVLIGLVENFWDTAHPEIEDGDDDARAAPFIWMNENLPLALKLHLVLLHVPDRVPSAASLADWDQALIADHQKGEAKKPDSPAGGNALTREDLTSSANGKNLLALVAMKEQLQHAAAKWDGLARLLDDKMRVNAPSVARVGEMLRRIERAVVSLIDGRDPQPAQDPATSLPAAEIPFPMPEDEPMDAQTPTPEAAAGALAPRSGPIASREDAYRMLEVVAAYLQKTEPHSPTPYLVQRAVTWGRMSLADLMQEVVREEGDIARYFSLLGIKETRE
ncbi:type VI secretion system protein TssA [Polaromonas sp. UC242_47]|uniref:type VI secretion system protein TssA n=1 Tax=Polaromonas sp. UC242_47 TaxID=3374626 RepID=UPI00378D08A9